MDIRLDKKGARMEGTKFGSDKPRSYEEQIASFKEVVKTDQVAKSIQGQATRDAASLVKAAEVSVNLANNTATESVAKTGRTGNNAEMIASANKRLTEARANLDQHATKPK